MSANSVFLKYPACDAAEKLSVDNGFETGHPQAHLVRERNNPFKLLFLILFISFLIISQTACGRKAEPVVKDGFYLDTVCQVSIYAMDGMSQKKAETVIDGAYDVCKKYEALLSKTAPDSDIYRINHAGGTPVTCAPETVALLKQALQYCDISGGLFDITVGQVTDLWNFHSLDAPSVPPAEKIAAALPHVDYHQIVINGKEVSMKDPAGEIDLGAVAKGYIADRMGEYLKKQGVRGAVIDLGGNIAAVGYKDGEKEDFKVGIKKPFSKSGEIVGILSGHDRSIVTSGIYERYFEVNGKGYHHIMNVHTGYPADTELSSATVIGPIDGGMNCDALATVCLLLKKDDALALIEGMDGYDALFIDNNGKLTKTAGLENFTAK